MAKPPSVIRLRHRKMKHLEVHLYQDQKTRKVKGHLIDWTKPRVTTFEEDTERGAEEQPP